MSDLQISLLIIGAAVVGAVYLFNWVQERKFRRTLGEAFESEREDVLLKTDAQTGGRVEPQLQREPETAAMPAASREAPREAGPAPAIDAALDYVAAVEADTPVPESAIEELLSRAAAIGKPCRAMGLNPESGQWEDLARGTGGRCTGLRVALQLVNRAGPVNAAQLAMFCDAVRHCAARSSAVASCPDAQTALATARDLDAFCAEVDIAIGINIVAAEGETFPGGRLRVLAEAAGFKLEPDGVFRLRDERRRTLFTLDNHEPAPFIPEQIANLSTGGVTLLLDVPLVEDGVEVFDRMLEVGTGLAASLGGSLVDDNRAALNAAGIAGIRQQLAGIHATMEARGIRAGGANASRLFS